MTDIESDVLAVFMRHGDALAPPDGLTFDSCIKIIALVGELKEVIAGTPLIISGREHEAVVTAGVVAALFDTTPITHSALSEDGSDADTANFAALVAQRRTSIVPVTHRKRMAPLFAALETLTGKRIALAGKKPGKHKPALSFRILERRPKAIVINVATMEARYVFAKKRAK